MRTEPADTCRILIVDDNHDAADALVSLLGVFGFDAYAVYDGEQALLAFATLRPSLVFLDIDMPGLDGYGAATCLRQSEQTAVDGSLKIVALTARGSAADRAMTAAVGFDLHVQKPIESAQLCELARQAYAA